MRCECNRNTWSVPTRRMPASSIPVSKSTWLGPVSCSPPSLLRWRGVSRRPALSRSPAKANSPALAVRASNRRSVPASAVGVAPYLAARAPTGHADRQGLGRRGFAAADVTTALADAAHRNQLTGTAPCGPGREVVRACSPRSLSGRRPSCSSSPSCSARA